MTSQLQEKISNKALAQRRARMEPIPSQIKPAANRTYVIITGATVGKVTAAFLPTPATDCHNMKSTISPARHPNPTVITPKTINPVERSL
jgi:hypothetical protein